MKSVDFLETLSTKLSNLTLKPGRFIFTTDTHNLYIDTESNRICIGGKNITDNIVQSDWNEADSTSYSFIQNKPDIPSVSVTDETLVISSS